MLGIKITADTDCSHEIKRRLLLRMKAINLESPLDYKKVKSVNPKGNQPLIFTGRTDAEAEALAIDVKNCLIGKDPDAGKDSRQEEKGTTEDEMIGWHH